MNTFFVSKSEYEEVLKQVAAGEKNKPLIEQLYSAKILVDNDFSETDHLDRINKLVFDGVQVRVMVLHLTDYCNLRCKYCFIEGNIGEDYCRESMTTEVVTSAIEKFVQVLKDYKKPANPSIVFYGGEPLANWNTMEYALEYLEKYAYLNIDKILITNGTLFDESIAKKLKKFGVHVSVSLDGDEKHTNINRQFVSGEGAFAKAIHGIELLRAAGIEPSVSCVLSKENVENATDIIDYFANKLQIKALGFNHVSIVPNLNYYDEKYEKAFAEKLISVQERIQKFYPEIYERRMNHKINCFLDKRLLRADCTGCGEQMSVSPMGEIGICQGYMGSRKTFNNTVFDANYLPKNDPVFQEWSTRSPLTMQECHKCIALATCGGGCPRNADVLTGSIWNPDLPFCHFAKLAQEWMIWRLESDE